MGTGEGVDRIDLYSKMIVCLIIVWTGLKVSCNKKNKTLYRQRWSGHVLRLRAERPCPIDSVSTTLPWRRRGNHVVCLLAKRSNPVERASTVSHCQRWSDHVVELPRQAPKLLSVDNRRFNCQFNTGQARPCFKRNVVFFRGNQTTSSSRANYP